MPIYLDAIFMATNYYNAYFCFKVHASLFPFSCIKILPPFLPEILCNIELLGNLYIKRGSFGRTLKNIINLESKWYVPCDLMIFATSVPGKSLDFYISLAVWFGRCLTKWELCLKRRGTSKWRSLTLLLAVAEGSRQSMIKKICAHLGALCSHGRSLYRYIRHSIKTLTWSSIYTYHDCLTEW